MGYVKNMLNTKTSHSSISESFNINNQCTDNKYIISHSFNTYYTNIGATLAIKIIIMEQILSVRGYCQCGDRL